MILLNDDPISITYFQDNTSQVWKIKNEIDIKNEITWVFSHESEFMLLAQLKNLVDQYGSCYAVLNLPYLPYAKQDQKISNQTLFALRVFAKLLNTLMFQEIKISGDYNETAIYLIKNSRYISK